MKMLRLVLCLSLMALCPIAAYAQGVSGSIAGLVTDPSGAVVPNAEILVTDLDRNTTIRTQSNDTGFYVVTPLQPGVYRVEVTLTGFQRYVMEPFPIATQQRAALDVTLDVGEVTETVTVTGSVQLLDTTTSTLSQVVENKKIIDLPLNGRNVYSLAALTPGVMGRRPALGITLEGFHSIGIFTVNGGRDSSNAIHMDGVPVTMNSNTNNMNANSALPTVEGVEEFRIQTNSYSADYGRSGGGIISIATKSGTNEYHGTLFDFLRNSKMDSNNYFANTRGQDLGTFQRNEFGGSIGGPIVKNKTFFFNAFEGRRQRSQSVRTFTLPTALEKGGDFSQTLNSSGNLRVIHDPFNATPDPNRAGEFLRQPFAGNKIPMSAMDPVALNTQGFYGPGPNSPGRAFTGRDNFVHQGAIPNDANRNTFKIDHHFTQNQRLFVRHAVFDVVSARPEYWPGPGCPDGGCFTNNEAMNNAVVDYSATLNPTTLLSVRYGFARSILDRGSWFQGFEPTEIGLPPEVQVGADLLVFPEFSIEEMTAPGLRHHWNFRSANMAHTAVGTLSKVIGSHNLKMGTEIKVNLINHMQASWQLLFQFNRGMTAGPDPRRVSSDAGFGYASFLLGAGSGGRVTNGTRPGLSNKSFGFYAQDDWKVSPKLTLNLGVRWDFETGLSERYDRYAVFDPDVRSPLSDETGLDLKGGWLFPGSTWDGGSRNLRSPEYLKFAPRVGLAYQLRQSTVIRVGFGIFYAAAPYGANNYGTAPYRASTPWVTSLDGVTPNNLLNDPFPDGVIQPPGAGGGLLAGNGLGVGSPQPYEAMTTPYNQQWNFTIAQELGSQTAFEISYAGNKGVHLPIRNGWQMNQLTPDQISPDNGILELVDNPLFGSVPTGVMSNPKVQRGRLMTRFIQYPGVSFQAPSWGNSNYHSLQFKLTKRFATGDSVVVAYTFAKLLSDGGDNAWDSALWRNYHCRACEKSVSSYDQRGRLVANFNYELPLGRGKKIGTGWNSFMNGVLGQWKINGIFTLNSGNPLEFHAPGNTSFSFGGRQWPNTNGQNAKLDNPTIDQWFDTSSITIPEPYTFGNMGRLHPSLRTDFIEAFDFSVFKNFSVTERLQVQFRAEWFNLANHPIFGFPGTTPGRSNFGAITRQANRPRQTQLALKIIF